MSVDVTKFQQIQNQLLIILYLQHPAESFLFNLCLFPLKIDNFDKIKTSESTKPQTCTWYVFPLTQQYSGVLPLLRIFYATIALHLSSPYLLICPPRMFGNHLVCNVMCVVYVYEGDLSLDGFGAYFSLCIF